MSSISHAVKWKYPCVLMADLLTVPRDREVQFLNGSWRRNFLADLIYLNVELRYVPFDETSLTHTSLSSSSSLGSDAILRHVRIFEVRRSSSFIKRSLDIPTRAIRRKKQLPRLFQFSVAFKVPKPRWQTAIQKGRGETFFILIDNSRQLTVHSLTTCIGMLRGSKSMFVR
jgi:hypothetical protein